MLIAKLSTDKIVQYLRPPTLVNFSKRRHVLVANNLTKTPSKIDPYWVPETCVIWVHEFMENK